MLRQLYRIIQSKCLKKYNKNKLLFKKIKYYSDNIAAIGGISGGLALTAYSITENIDYIFEFNDYKGRKLLFNDAPNFIKIPINAVYIVGSVPIASCMGFCVGYTFTRLIPIIAPIYFGINLYNKKLNN